LSEVSKFAYQVYMGKRRSKLTVVSLSGYYTYLTLY